MWGAKQIIRIVENQMEKNMETETDTYGDNTGVVM